MSKTAPASKKEPSERRNDPYLFYGIGLGVLFAVILPILFVLVNKSTARFVPISTTAMTQQSGGQETGGAGGGTDAQSSTGGGFQEVRMRVAGEQVYKNACMVCHGPTGEGIPSLGKPLHNSAFVQEHSDAELFKLIVDGRAPTDPLNTTGSLMPPRGAVGLKDQQVHEVVAFLRSIQDPSQPTASLDAWQPKEGQSGGGRVAIELKDNPGYKLYIVSCAACHGEGAEGIDQLGLPLSTSGFVLGKTDKELVTFIKMGRSPWDPANTTGIDMPPKGGNPAITDDQLQQIVDYLRAVQKTALGG